MTGHEKMLRALAESFLSRPRGIVERLTFPMMRTVWRMGFEAGYATGHVDGQLPSAIAGDDSE